MSEEKLICMKCQINERQKGHTKCRNCIQESQNHNRKRQVSYARELESQLQSLQEQRDIAVEALRKIKTESSCYSFDISTKALKKIEEINENKMED